MENIRYHPAPVPKVLCVRVGVEEEGGYRRVGRAANVVQLAESSQRYLDCVVGHRLLLGVLPHVPVAHRDGVAVYGERGLAHVRLQER